eukprot:360753-Chlamydomonas_euryale.AAC.12
MPRERLPIHTLTHASLEHMHTKQCVHTAHLHTHLVLEQRPVGPDVSKAVAVSVRPDDVLEAVLLVDPVVERERERLSGRGAGDDDAGQVPGCTQATASALRCGLEGAGEESEGVSAIKGVSVVSGLRGYQRFRVLGLSGYQVPGLSGYQSHERREPGGRSKAGGSGLSWCGLAWRHAQVDAVWIGMETRSGRCSVDWCVSCKPEGLALMNWTHLRTCQLCCAAAGRCNETMK